MRLYNTLTRSKQDFVPADDKNVRMYVCGPTVYDFAHIGNARPVIVFDVLYRLLRHVYGADHVTYVRNITDVDDKINARAIRDFPGLPLNEAIRRVTETTAQRFQADALALGCLEPSVEPRATENIAEMVDIIGKLLASGHAYIASGPEGREVLFAVDSMSDYGQLSRRKLEDQQAGARVAVEAHKRNPGDFVLWKESAADEPGWDGTFLADGAVVTIFGRPGWHIECSAMSRRYLGETFDIHGGGLDLIFPHHENEIAQSRCAFGTEVMANVWMHNGFLQVEGQKMSKSLGNFVTIAELLETEKFGGRRWPGEVLRLAMLKTHYRQPIDFTVKALEEAEATLFKWSAQIQESKKGYGISLADGSGYGDPFGSADGSGFGFGQIGLAEVIGQLSDDLNTPAVLSLMHQITNPHEMIQVTNLMGIDLLGFAAKREAYENKAGENIEVQSLITARLAARAAKNWPESDRIRDELLAQGIVLKDNKDGTTTWEVKR